MKSGVAITLAVCSALYYAVTLVSGLEKRSIEEESTLPLTGDDLRDVANKLDIFNAVVTRIENTFPEQFKRSGNGGCAGFTGCAQLAAGQNALRNFMHSNRASLFTGASGPGKRKRSIVDSSTLPLTGDDLRLLAEEVDLVNAVISEMAAKYPEQFKRNGNGGCAGFTGCAQLAAGQSALQAMIHSGRASLFGSGGPGRRRRSTDEVLH
uniref:Calcitonin long transcript variant n=1 Tax=Ophionotus victoriae TaxID=667017 RepID=A0A220W0D5_9ECHI|nr:calcitonin precursor long transcript variant [Ophionotus victoriae]